jgi:hypothetical protein
LGVVAVGVVVVDGVVVLAFVTAAAVAPLEGASWTPDALELPQAATPAAMPPPSSAVTHVASSRLTIRTRQGSGSDHRDS